MWGNKDAQHNFTGISSQLNYTFVKTVFFLWKSAILQTVFVILFKCSETSWLNTSLEKDPTFNSLKFTDLVAMIISEHQSFHV